MRRITITVHENTTDEDALDMVLSVVRKGRISNTPHGESYCAGTWRMDGDPRGQLSCYAKLTRAGADSFTVWRRDAE